jgi:acyl carrier protein
VPGRHDLVIEEEGELGMDPALKEETQAAVYAFLENNFPLMRKRDVRPTEMLLEQGIIDSLGLLLVVEHLEATYGIQVGVEQMVVENFGSIAAITEFILRQRAPRPPEASPPAAVLNPEKAHPAIRAE